MLAISVFFGLLALSLGIPHTASKRNNIHQETKIVNGHGAYIEDFPYMVSVRYYVADIVEEHICGGSILSKDWALTTASCTSQYSAHELRVRAGQSNSDVGEKHDVSTVINNVVCLLKMKTPIVFSTSVQPVKLASANTAVSAGVEGTLAGWGTVEIGGLPLHYLRQLEVPVLSSKNCAANYPSGLTEESMFCAGYEEAGKGPCKGDEGGPLVINNTQVGVLSWGIECAAAKHPGVYTKISYYRDWITGQTGV